MNNSFEQLIKKKYHTKELPAKNDFNLSNAFKKQHKMNHLSKNKQSQNSNYPKHPSEPHQSSMISSNSVEKTISKIYATKSIKKKTRKDQNSGKKNKMSSFLKKCPTIQLTKKQKDIRQAIEYRYDKSKMRTYRFHCVETRLNETEDLKVRQIIDQQQEEKFSQMYGYLNQFKVVNLYDYHRYKEETMLIKKEKENHKLIVIKNSKKKRQNSDTVLSIYQVKNDRSKQTQDIHSKIALNPNLSHYFSNNPTYIQSQRNHTQSSVHHQRNKSESPAHKFKLEFPSSKVFIKQKSGSKSKIKTQNQFGLNQKIIASSSVQKNLKSIKDIYLNAISNLANKNTMKTNHKLFKSQNQMKNKASRSLLYESQKKPLKSEYQSTRLDKNNSSSALQQNYFSCISSRQNKKEEKKNTCFRKTTKEKLQKTVLINDINASHSSQWKSIIMKVDDTYNSQSKEIIEGEKQSKKFKLKFKNNGFERGNRNCFTNSNGKSIGYPHSYRENLKSPKLKNHIIYEDDQNLMKKKTQRQKMVSSAKNLNHQTFQNLLNSSNASMQKEAYGLRKSKK